MWYLTKWDCQNLTKGNVFFWLQHIFFPYITPKHILRSSVFSTWKSEVFDFWKWRNRMFPFPCYSLGVELCFFFFLSSTTLECICVGCELILISAVGWKSLVQTFCCATAGGEYGMGCRDAGRYGGRVWGNGLFSFGQKRWMFWNLYTQTAAIF